MTPRYGKMQGAALARLASLIADEATQRPLQGYYTLYILSNAVKSIDVR